MFEIKVISVCIYGLSGWVLDATNFSIKIDGTKFEGFNTHHDELLNLESVCHTISVLY